jgi:alkylation response protein AidB-like acyl-CoA dehydrogenase
VDGFELQPRTDAGRKFCELAEQHASEIAPRAAEHDRNGTFPFEAIDEMKASGFLTGPVPTEFGGLGMSSLHDLMVGISRVARADGSLGIAINMHFSVAAVMHRLLRGARERDDPAAEGLEQMLSLLGNGVIAMANATEPGTDVAHPMTEVTRVEGGWRVDGHKIFGTLSPVADVMTVTCRRREDDGSYVSGTAIVFRGTPGQAILDNWDALGMRASGSNDIVYDNCVIPEEFFFTNGSPWGELDESRLLIGTAANLGLLGAFVGIAEAARNYVADFLRKRTKQPTGRPLAERHGVQHGMAELEILLQRCRAHLSSIAAHTDRVVVDTPVSSVSIDDLHQLMAVFQATKLDVQRTAIDVVDKALQLSGGAGYLANNPLGRWYRDVRAGPFMQPLSVNEAHEYIGRVALGLPPGTED